ncbi:hypothetical protein Lal_00031809 [Lupinus albus]|nr:hypothetical protein Lal_00031809 [Lupinus albus]
MPITTSIMGIRSHPNSGSKAARQHITIFSISKKTCVAKSNANGQKSMKSGFKCGRIGNSVLSTVFLILKLCITTRNICSGIYKSRGDTSPQMEHILLE